MDGADTGAVVTAVFHPLQAVDQSLRNRFLADDPDNSAHTNSSKRKMRW